MWPEGGQGHVVTVTPRVEIHKSRGKRGKKDGEEDIGYVYMHTENPIMMRFLKFSDYSSHHVNSIMRHALSDNEYSDVFVHIHLLIWFI